MVGDMGVDGDMSIFFDGDYKDGDIDGDCKDGDIAEIQRWDRR
jgi:hypothetical protein